MSADMVPTVLAYLGGYMLVLATPGPNLLLVGSLAALRGFRAAMPMAVGLGVGSGSLGGVFYMLAGLLPDTAAWNAAGHVAAACFLSVVALRVARSAMRGLDAPQPEAGLNADFAAGFMTAVTNPITGLFFAAQFVGPSSDLPVPASMALLAVTGVLAFLKATIVAGVLSHGAVRRRVMRAFRPWAGAVAMLFLGLALMHLRPVVVLAAG